MQIVQELGGYTLGRADLVRRAMSKKKHEVMQAERQNFVYGNPEEGVPGAISKGVPEDVANKIFDEMIAFASYAFNKSHAAAYAVVAYWTAWLKFYYREEFMAALMTSVIDNSAKVSDYILSCRQMKIEILPPDINMGRGEFSVQGGKIRYGLNAIRGIGKAVVSEIVKEREKNGLFKSASDFMARLSAKEVNKKTLENFIKSGAFDCFGHTRKQEMAQYPILLEESEKSRKDSVIGQQSLFDFMRDIGHESAVPEMNYPPVGEFDKEQLLQFEKETLGIYVSGHPLEQDTGLLKKNVTAKSSDFIVDDESGAAKVEDGMRVVVGGIISDRVTKTTKANQMMAILTIEDLVGSVEVLVFPKDFEKWRGFLNTDARVLISGRVSIGDDPKGKLVLENIMPFEDVPRDIWVRFDDKAQYEARIGIVREIVKGYDGRDGVVVYLKDVKQYLRMPMQFSTSVRDGAAEALSETFGEENVAVVYGSVNWQSR